jgi:hypothetical protein
MVCIRQYEQYTVTVAHEAILEDGIRLAYDIRLNSIHDRRYLPKE